VQRRHAACRRHGQSPGRAPATPAQANRSRRDARPVGEIAPAADTPSGGCCVAQPMPAPAGLMRVLVHAGIPAQLDTVTCYHSCRATRDRSNGEGGLWSKRCH